MKPDSEFAGVEPGLCWKPVDSEAGCRSVTVIAAIQVDHDVATMTLRLAVTVGPPWRCGPGRGSHCQSARRAAQVTVSDSARKPESRTPSHRLSLAEPGPSI